jgi:hypothetical protein
MNNTLDILLWLQNWFVDQCNGEWEHSYGIMIETLDNPGWSVTIDIAGTYLKNKTMEKVSIERSENDWISCSVVDRKFMGYGGAKQLGEILEYFRSWSDRNYELGKETEK